MPRTQLFGPETHLCAENCRLQQFSAHQCIAGARGACAVQCTRAPRAASAQYAPPVCKSVAERTASTHGVCMNHSACVL